MLLKPISATIGVHRIGWRKAEKGLEKPSLDLMSEVNRKRGRPGPFVGHRVKRVRTVEEIHRLGAACFQDVENGICFL